jgi:hypothetical protein
MVAHATLVYAVDIYVPDLVSFLFSPNNFPALEPKVIIMS